MEGESDNLEWVNLTIGHTYQFVAQRSNKDDEYIFCVFPKTWDKDHLYGRLIQKGKTVHLRCVKQGTSIRLPKEEALRVQCFNHLFDPNGEKPPEVILSGGKNGRIADDVSEDELVQHIHAVFLLNNLKIDHLSGKGEENQSSSMDSFNLHSQFVRQLKPLLNEVKRSYLEVTRTTSSLQGRLTTKGRRDLLMKPSARFECSFDEFSVNSPIYQVLATCVDQISASGLTSRFPWLHQQFSQCRRDTRLCQRKLAGIAPFTVPVARQESKRLARNLPRSFRSYRSVLRLAGLILSNSSFATNESENGDMEYRVLHKGTSSDVWEAYLYTGLSGLGCDVQAKVKYNSVWESKGNGKAASKEIDLTINAGEELIDAKFYKQSSEDKNTTLTASNQHQMFYYLLAQYSLHLKKSGQKSPMPKRITLIRPNRDEQTDVKSTLDERQMDDEPMRHLLGILNEKASKGYETNFPPIREIAVPLAGPVGIQKLLDEKQLKTFETNHWVVDYLEKNAVDLKKRIWR